MWVQWWGYHEVVGTLKPYLMQKNLFGFFSLTGSRDVKTLSMCSCAIIHAIVHAQKQQATWWNFHYLIFDIVPLRVSRKDHDKC